MNTVKRLVTLFGMILLTFSPAAGMDASGAYVPTIAKTYIKQNGKWVDSHSKKFVFKKDGRITQLEAGFEVRNYSWKGNYVFQQNYTGQGTGTWTFKYKNGLRQSKVFESADDTTTYSYKWKKRKASVKYTTVNIWNEDAGITSITTKVNEKKQITSVKTKYRGGLSILETFVYYKNGNLKEKWYKFGDSGPTITKYNEDGYIISLVDNFGSSNESTSTYKYTMDKKKKCPKSVLVKSKDSYGSRTQKTVFSSFKKVSRVRNCDASGYVLPLGINPF